MSVDGRVKTRGNRGRAWLLRLYRIGIVLAIAWLMRDQQLRQRVQGDRPITVSEVRALLPEAASFRVEKSPHQALEVLGEQGEIVGRVLRSSPLSDHVIGYTGPLDLLIVFGDTGLTGISIRHSYDTPSHITDVVDDYIFMESWNGMSAEAIAKQDLEAAGVEGVSGATRTSMCVAHTLVHRLNAGDPDSATGPGWSFGVIDFALLLVLVGGVVLSFAKKLKHKKKIRRFYQIGVFVYLGFISGDLLALSLFKGWAEFAVPFEHLPGLVVLVGAAFVLPWATGKPVYCGQVCPHGIAQEFLSRNAPKSWRIKLSPNVAWALRRLPPLLIAIFVAGSLMMLKLDPANLEAFDAYLLGSAAIASIVIAIVSLCFSATVPMGYCKYACPTGALLEYVRTHGRADRFGTRDWGGAAMLAMAWLLHRYFYQIQEWILNCPYV